MENFIEKFTFNEISNFNGNRKSIINLMNKYTYYDNNYSI